MRFTINRKLWLRGEGGQVSRLIRSSDGKMCCLGSFGLACGVPKADMLDLKDPLYVFGNTYRDAATWLFRGKDVSGACVDLMQANDTQHTTPRARELTITKLFAEHGIEVTFRG